MKKPCLTFDELKEFQTSVSDLSFDTGKPINSNGPVLLNLNTMSYMRAGVARATPLGEHSIIESWRDFDPDPPSYVDSRAMQYYRPAHYFSDTVKIWLRGSQRVDDSLLRRTRWTDHWYVASR